MFFRTNISLLGFSGEFWFETDELPLKVIVKQLQLKTRNCKERICIYWMILFKFKSTMVAYLSIRGSREKKPFFKPRVANH